MELLRSVRAAQLARRQGEERTQDAHAEGFFPAIVNESESTYHENHN
jgi:hypothetical protein